MAKRKLKIIRFEIPSIVVPEPTLKSEDNKYEKNLKKKLKERKRKDDLKT